MIGAKAPEIFGGAVEKTRKKPQKPVSLGSKYLELSTDQRILLDTFGDLPEEVQKEKLLEIVALARKYNQEKQDK